MFNPQKGHITPEGHTCVCIFNEKKDWFPVRCLKSDELQSLNSCQIVFRRPILLGLLNGVIDTV